MTPFAIDSNSFHSIKNSLFSLVVRFFCLIFANDNQNLLKK